MPKGYLNIVLHAHLPYVRHPESEEYIEERWLFEAISETYIPLLIYFQKLVDENIKFKNNQTSGGEIDRLFDRSY